MEWEIDSKIDFLCSISYNLVDKLKGTPLLSF